VFHGMMGIFDPRSFKLGMRDDIARMDGFRQQGKQKERISNDARRQAFTRSLPSMVQVSTSLSTLQSQS